MSVTELSQINRVFTDLLYICHYTADNYKLHFVYRPITEVVYLHRVLTVFTHHVIHDDYYQAVYIVLKAQFQPYNN